MFRNGQRIGRLQVIENLDDGDMSAHHHQLLMRCECGRLYLILASGLAKAQRRMEVDPTHIAQCQSCSRATKKNKPVASTMTAEMHWAQSAKW